MAGCIIEGGDELPNTIIDPATISVTLDNQGLAILQVAVLTKNTGLPSINFCKFNLGEVTFRGFLVSDTPQRFEGTDYYEHQMTAKGAIC
jgi:hypothetical protein